MPVGKQSSGFVLLLTAALPSVSVISSDVPSVGAVVGESVSSCSVGTSVEPVPL